MTKVYFTINGFRVICDHCKMNGHNLIAMGETPQPAPPDAKCECMCHKKGKRSID